MANDFDLDDINFDDFEFEDFDTFGDEVKGDRKPIERFKASFSKTAKTTAKSPAFYTRLVRKALPRHYQEAMDAVDEIKAQGEDLYNSAVERASPTVREVKKRAQGLIPKAKKYLPKAIADKVEKLLEVDDYEYGRFSESKQREDQISMILADIFTEQYNETAKANDERRATEVFKEVVNNKRHKQSIATNEAIREGISRLVGYQDRVAFKFQQKSLELQYRQLFATRDIITESQRQARESNELLKGILKNTGLPDAVKLRQTEHFGLLTRERFIRRVHDGLESNVRGVITRVGQNLKNMAREKITTFSDLIDQGLMSSDMSGGLVNPADMAGQFAGTVGAEYGSDLIARRLGRLLGRNRFLRSSNAKIGSFLSNAPSLIRDFANSDPYAFSDVENKAWWQQDDLPGEFVNGQYKNKGFLKRNFGRFLGFSRGLLRDEGSEDLTIGDASATMSQPVPFTKRMGLSITDVIPGLLSRQLRELTMLRTGNDAPLLAFDFGRGTFTTNQNLKESIAERVSRRTGKQSVRYQFEEILSYVDPNKKLSDNAERALERQMLLSARAGRGFHVNELSNVKRYDASIGEKEKQELAAHFKEQFMDQRSGGKYANPILDERIRDATQAYQGLASSLPAVIDELELQLSLGNGDILKDLGLLVEDKGSLRFNFEAIMEMLLKEESNFKRSARSNYYRHAQDGSADSEMWDFSIASVKDGIRNKVSRARDRLKRKPSMETFKQNARSGFSNLRSKVEGGLSATDTSIVKGHARSLGEMLARGVDSLSEEGKRVYEQTKSKLNAELKSGTYYDAVTGRMVKRLEDIRNDIVDADGKIVIYAKDVKDILTEGYRGGKNAYEGIGTSMQSSHFSALKKFSSSSASLKAKAQAYAGMIKRGVSSSSNAEGFLALQRAEDALNAELRAGEYRDKVTGRIVKNVNDIVNDVIDVSGDVIIKANDLKDRATQSVEQVSTRAVETVTPWIDKAQSTDPGNISPVNTLLSQLVEIQTGALESIATIRYLLETGINVTGEGGVQAVKGGGRQSFIRTGLRRGVGAMLKGMGNFYKGVYSGFGKIAGGAGGLIGGGLRLGGSLLGGLAQRKSDIYAKGDPEPVITARELRQGKYIDKLTGKPVKRLKDITGPVIDAEGNEVVTADQFRKGLYDNSGKSLIGSSLRWLGGFYGAMFSPLTMAARLTTSAMKGLANALTRPKDIYVSDDLKAPKLYAKVMERGGYFSQTTGRVIKSIKDIDGPVMDHEGLVVLSSEDLHKGLVDQYGKPIKTLSDRVIGLGKGAYDLGMGLLKGIGRYTMGVWKGGLGLAKWGARKVRRLFAGKTASTNEEAQTMATMETADILAQIYQLLDDRLPGKRVLGDIDGDGIRDNSWRDILRKRKAKAEADKEKAGGPSKSGNNLLKGLFGALGGGLSSLLGLGKSDTEASEGDTNIVTGDLFGGGDEDGKKGRKGKKPGKIGRFLQRSKLGRGLMGARNLLSWRGAGQAAMWGLRGLGAIVAAPIVIKGLAIAAIGYGLYKSYRYITGKDNTELHDIRLMQYGIDPTNEDNGKRIMYLEDEVKSLFKINKEQAQFSINDGTLQRIMEGSGIPTTDEQATLNFVKWFNDRFKPVYTAHRLAADAINPGATLEDADQKFSPSLKLNYLDRISFGPGTPNGPYSQTVAPFGEGTTHIDPRAIVKAIEAAKEKFKAKIKDDTSGATSKRDRLIGGTLAAIPGAALSYAAIRKARDLNLTKNDASQALTASKSTIATGGMVNTLSEKKAFSVLDMVRFKTYGLNEFEITRVRAIQELERSMLKYTTFNEKGNAILSGDAETLARQHGPVFGVSSDNSKAFANWVIWFNNRFAPTYVEFCTAVRKFIDSGDTLSVLSYLKPEEKVDVAVALSAAKTSTLGRSVWDVIASPWPDYTLNTDSASIQGNLAVLRNETKQREIMDRVIAFTDIMPGSKPVADRHKKPFNMLEKVRPSTYSVENSLTVASANPHKGFPDGRKSYLNIKTNKITDGSYIMPTEGRISSEYGNRVDPITGRGNDDHKGIDIAAARGTPVRAAATGVIIRRDFSQSYGNVIYIKHPDGNVTRYAHLNHFHPSFSMGSHVNQGDIIGYVGDTGASRGDHLHFEIRKGDRFDSPTIDPFKLLDGSYAAQAKKELDIAKKEIKKEESAETIDPLEGKDTIASTVLQKGLIDRDKGFADQIKGKAPADLGNTAKQSKILEALDPKVKPSTVPVGDFRNPSLVAASIAKDDKKLESIRASQIARVESIEQSSTAQAATMRKSNEAIISVLEKSLKEQKMTNVILGDVRDALGDIHQTLQNSPMTTMGGAAGSAQGRRPTEIATHRNTVDLRKPVRH